MIFYRVAYLTGGGCSDGFSWHGSRNDAARAAAQAHAQEPAEYQDAPPKIVTFDIEPTKSGLLSFLNQHLSYADNG